MSQKDQLFQRFMIGLFIVLLCYGTGMLVVVLWGDHALGAKLINGFSALFTGALGLGSGYLLGKNGKNGDGP